MSHFAAICPDLSGHLNPMMAVSRQLQQRGHTVTFYQPPAGKAKVENAGFTCRIFGQQEFSEDAREARLARLAELKGIKAMRFTIDVLTIRTEACLRDVAPMLMEDKVDAVMVDQVCPEGATLAEVAALPFVTVSNALVLHAESAVPPCYTSWRFGGTIVSRFRNYVANRVLRRLTRPIIRAVNEHRVNNRLLAYETFQAGHSPLLQLSQQPAEFEYPRTVLPPHFHFTGPWTDAGTRESTDFPFDKLDGRPLVYASMGTLQNRLGDVFRSIASACEELPVQLVISLGGGASPEEIGPLLGSPIIVKFAPQLQLLDRAALCVTHAGLNTALECLARGVPMVAIPVTNDQPGVAARLAWCGAGVFIAPAKVTPQRLRLAIEKVSSDPAYKAAAMRMKDAIARTGGPARAADLIEEAMRTGKPVVNGAAG